jgi:uncharacterized protein (TIGR02569 family)
MDEAADGAWRCGEVVLKPSTDAVAASWLAGVLEHLRVEGIRIARPLRSSDGRWVVGGWTAQRLVAGRPAPRYREIVAAGDALHASLAALPRPRFLADRTDLYAWADALSWGEADDADRLGDGHGARLFAELAGARREVSAAGQLVHGDLFGNVLFAGAAPPAVVDIVPFWRPPGWATAVVVVDAVTWGDAGPELLDDWSGLPEWEELLRRALLFRLAVSLAHPRTTPGSLVAILTTAELIRPRLT